MNIKTLCLQEYKRITVTSLLNPLEEALSNGKHHPHAKSSTTPTGGNLYANTNNGTVAKQKEQRRKGVTRKCPQCAVVKTSPQWREGPDGQVNLCNACGLFYRKVFLVFGKNLAKRYFNEIKGVSVKRKVPKSLYGVARTR
ncbi:gat3p [Saccharomyces arboricola H-6]|uniref:Gat3p n=1 Tax=Saccharomyces arboricola (strain H-6 / AS 2.3317 / CBS 10644) TaxID=1160507 RepID=J8PZG7_SACAR|nr:gat3p [Saccharomyces arboricola H-6]